MANKISFAKFSMKIAHLVGSPVAFAVSLAGVVLWFVSGPYFEFSDTWQLAINTTTTIVTFLMVFLIQNTQNRDAKALHLKLDELIFAISTADNYLLDAEELSEPELEQLSKKYQALRSKLLTRIIEDIK
jgi:low affinity Fe/Cu permease